MKSLLLILGFIFPLIAASQHAVPDFTHVPYGPGENNWLNIYLAEGKGKKPLLIFAHANGSTADQFPASVWNELKKEGISAISWESVPQVMDVADYQICEKDFLKVLEWMERNAEVYGFDLENIILCGRSRGTVASWSAFHTYPEKFKGAYMLQALPNRTWAFNDQTRDYTTDVTAKSPFLFFAFADGLDTSDGHTPLNGLKIKVAYEKNGIADRFFLEYNMGKEELYKPLLSFIREVMN